MSQEVSSIPGSLAESPCLYHENLTYCSDEMSMDVITDTEKWFSSPCTKDRLWGSFLKAKAQFLECRCVRGRCGYVVIIPFDPWALALQFTALPLEGQRRKCGLPGHPIKQCRPPDRPVLVFPHCLHCLLHWLEGFCSRRHPSGELHTQNGLYSCHLSNEKTEHRLGK